MAKLRILHLTDLHLRNALPGTADRRERLSRDMPAVLDRLSRRLAGLSPDVIAITGDLLDVPDDVVDGRLADDDRTAYDAAVRESAADYRLMRDWMDGTGAFAIAIPGNHDHRGAFAGVFGTTTPDIDLGDWRFVGFDDDLGERRQPVRPAREAERLAAALGDAAGTPQIHLQHYTVAPRLFRRTAYTYDGAGDLCRRIEESPRVRCVISGHYHPGALARGRNGVAYSTAPAFCEAPFRFRLVDLRDAHPPSVTDLSVD